MKYVSGAALVAFVVCGACGSQEKDPAPVEVTVTSDEAKTSATAETTAADETPDATETAPVESEDSTASPELTTFEAIPEAAIVRVPLDGEMALYDDPEMRLTETFGQLFDAELSGMWSGGRQPQQLLQRRDQHEAPPSQQAWLGWESSELYGDQYDGRNQADCRAQRGDSRRHQGCVQKESYWKNNYKPVLMWQGRQWNYQYAGQSDRDVNR